MIHRRIVTGMVSIALIALTVTAASAGDLSGTWRGWFNIVGGDADRQGELALEIKDDSTYTMTWTRKGSKSSESGVVVENGRMVNLRNASGQQLSLVHDGETLYGLSSYSSGGHPVQVSVTRANDSEVRPSALPRLDSGFAGNGSDATHDPVEAP
jgi:hypothetical protein